MKRCRICRTSDQSLLCKNKARKDGVQSICRDCQKKLSKNHYVDNRQSYKDKAKINDQVRVIANRVIIAAFRAEGCRSCPEKSSACLVAHHTDPSKKDFNISSAPKRATEKVTRELAKCICLCMNCHAKFHAGEIQFAPMT